MNIEGLVRVSQMLQRWFINSMALLYKTLFNPLLACVSQYTCAMRNEPAKGLKFILVFMHNVYYTRGEL